MKRFLSKVAFVASRLVAVLSFAGAVSVPAQQAGSAHESGLQLNAAPHESAIEKTMVLGATLAGERIVAVGEEGAILLSDDGGRTFRQAKHVPADSTLTSVTFVDDRNGWAAGHWGVILRTGDGGETWTLQRSDTSVDQPIFGIAFKDQEHGWAVGLWSLMLKTDDGGKTWQTQKAEKGAGMEKGGVNLYSVFLGEKKDVFATGEQGLVLKSADDGEKWTVLHTGYKGSLWTGATLGDGAIYVGGLRGHVFRSDDGGTTWMAVVTGGTSSITQLLATDKGIAGVGLDGLVIFKKTAANEFKSHYLSGRDPLTALVVNARGQEVFFSKNGVGMVIN